MVLDKCKNDAYNSNNGANKEVNQMAETEQQSILKMGEAVAQLPEEKKQFFLGFAEGVTEGIAAMTPYIQPDPAPTQPS